ncbi:MAG: YcaO-like family protein [Candidatus Magasanikbacteria bacterium]|nr:YcaO-like family protein [Candidatus Magasanikbacteria bacterium]
MKTVYPIVLCGSNIGKSSTTFYPPLREVDVSMPSGLARELIKADGTKSVEQLIDELAEQWDRESLEALFAVLIEKGIFLNSHNLSGHVMQFGLNPTPWHGKVSDKQALKFARNTELQQPDSIPDFEFSIEPTALGDLFVARKSVRQFDGTAIEHASIEQMLWAAYGATQHNALKGVTRTVPTAGGLYALIVHLALFHGTESLPAGIYRATSTTPEKVSLNHISDDVAPVLYSFFQQGVLRGAAGVMILSGCFERMTSKYGNRGISYTILEAGHAAQNIHLAAVQERFATLEMGGFQEMQLSAALNLDPSWMPLTTIVFGNELTDSKPKSSTLTRDQAIETIIDRFEMPVTTADGYTTPFHIVFAEVGAGDDPETWSSCGRSPDRSLAVLKATAEAVEWHACSRAEQHRLLSARFKDIQHCAIDPRTCAKYAPDQFTTSLGLTPFDVAEMYQWVPAINALTGEERLVLADFVYFPYKPLHGVRFAYGNSSGTAAHTVMELAQNSALLELVERDAFMIHWFNRLTPPRAILRPSDNFFSCSAASDFDFLKALDRAMMEAESSVYCRLRDGVANLKTVKPEEVESVDDHVALYQSRKYWTRAMFLLGDGRHVKTLQEIQATQQLLNRELLLEALEKMGFEPLFVDLSARDPLVRATGFHVVKAIIPGLVPMTFGYNKEPVQLDRITNVPVRLGLKVRPVRFYRLNRLPHPYN